MMKALAVLLIIMFLSMPPVSGATYHLNGYDETEFHEIQHGSLTAYDSDTYIISGSPGMEINLNISCDSPLLLDVRNSSGPFIYRDIEPESYSITFLIEDSDEYRIEITSNRSVNYTLDVSSEYEPPIMGGLMEYTAFSVCGVCIIVVFSVIALVYALHRANRRKGETYAGDTSSDDAPYRVK